MTFDASEFVASWRKCIASNDSTLLSSLMASVSGDEREQRAESLRDFVDADDHSRSLLMQACAAGNVRAVDFLLSECDAQRQWNALDANGLSAADLIPTAHPDTEEIEQLLLNAACRTELLLAAVFANNDNDDDNNDDDDDNNNNHHNNNDNNDNDVDDRLNDEKTEHFLNTPLRYESGVDGLRLMTGAKAGDGHDDAVMMTWEKDIMRMHVERFVAHGCKTVLNVGFGLGIIDSLIEELAADQLVEHVIIEAHPDVLRFMRESGWMNRPRVTVLEGTWQSQMPVLIERGVSFDCVFFDTFETLDDMRSFHEQLVSVLAFDGLYSFFNGLCGTNRFLHKVACALADIQLQDFGFSVFFEPIEVPALEHQIFTGCKRAYFSLTTYNLPHVTFPQ